MQKKYIVRLSADERHHLQSVIKLSAIAENLERLEWFGLTIWEEHNGIPHWHHTEAAVTEGIGQMTASCLG